MTSGNHLIGITMGDPKGIGPELLAQTWSALDASARNSLVLYGDANVFHQLETFTKVSFPAHHLRITSHLPFEHSQTPDHHAATIALKALDGAIADALSGNIQAIVTCPVNKSRMHQILPHFTGHTGYLAQKTHTKETVMLFVPPLETTPPLLRIALTTVHLPLSEVASALTSRKVQRTIEMVHYFLQKDLGILSPRIAVLGLNPHAGEEGILGTEEEQIIRPTIQELQHQGITAFGPFPGDALGYVIQEGYDAVIAMYHDQGLIPMKLLYPGKAINLTLGLPFLRSSPGHGTAEDKAWKHQANPEGLRASILLTHQLLHHRRRET